MYLPGSHLNCHHSLLHTAARQGQGHGHWISRHLSELSSWYCLKQIACQQPSFVQRECPTALLSASLQHYVLAVLVLSHRLRSRLTQWRAGTPEDFCLSIYLLVFKQPLNQDAVLTEQHWFGGEKKHSVRQTSLGCAVQLLKDWITAGTWAW